MNNDNDNESKRIGYWKTVRKYITKRAIKCSLILLTMPIWIVICFSIFMPIIGDLALLVSFLWMPFGGSYLIYTLESE